MTICRFSYKCDCIDPIIDKIIEKNYETEDIEAIYLEPVTLSGETASTLMVEFKKGKKKKRKVYLTHTYCPFCGKKILNKEGEQ